MGDFTLAEILYFLLRECLTGCNFHPGRKFLPVFHIRDTDHVYISNLWMVMKVFFDFPGVNIFTTPDDHVL